VKTCRFGPFAGRVEISGGGTTPNSAALRELKAPDPQLRGPIEIVIRTIARSHTRLDQVIYERMHGSAVLHSQRPQTSQLVAGFELRWR
jgi:hypothetical protein